MPSKKILISGASIAGPTLAFWLHKFGFDVSVVERAESLREGGQNIDIKGAAKTVAERMGLINAIRAADTGELGVRFVDSKGNVKAALPKGESDLGTSELEILRGDLSKILYNHSKNNVEYIFGDQISDLTEFETSVKVTFQSGKTQDFDLVIIAEGIRSRTRGLVFGDEPILKSTGLYISYFTIPRIVTDTDWAEWYNALGARVIMKRPDNEGTIRASFSFMSKEIGYERLPLAKQKEILKTKFADAGWEASRILAELDKGTEIYFDNISQTFAPNWSKGRVAITGDTAFCPSPLSGMGASVSMVGAYVLAGELARNTNYTEAFLAYDKAFRPYVSKIQKLPPGVPALAHPKGKLGIAILNTVINIISSNFVKKIGSLFSSKNKVEDDGIVLEDYERLISN
jgi:2-polyprenyl-6-methoxyphenol hydroxylase-like FAD-dependent oxidoreductase